MSLFCRDVCVEYLGLLAERLPDPLPCYLKLDATSIATQPLWQAQLLNPERFERFNLAVKRSSLPLRALAWESPSQDYGSIGQTSFLSRSSSEVTIGVCLPPMDQYQQQAYTGMDAALQALLHKQQPFRLIAENHLITEWDGLDYIVYAPTGLTYQGKRKLQGFCAAGGHVVTLGQPLQFSNEIAFDDFIHKY